jgi:hypothetical protein
MGAAMSRRNEVLNIVIAELDAAGVGFDIRQGRHLQDRVRSQWQEKNYRRAENVF